MAFEHVKQVQKKRCNQCLFSKNKIVSDQAKESILAECKNNNKHFVCHKGTIAGKDVMCRGFYDKTGSQGVSKFLEEVGLIKFVDVK